MTTPLGIYTETARELALGYGDEENGIRFVNDHYLGSGRWVEHHLIVFETANGLFGFNYDAPATEYQEGMDDEETFELAADGTVFCFPVVAETTITHKRADT